MFHALYTAASGMTAQQINLANIANNLANASTAGFQSRRVQFSDLLYQSEVMPGSAATQSTTVAAGLQVIAVLRPAPPEEMLPLKESSWVWLKVLKLSRRNSNA